jgi:hypothetical protein
MKTKFVYKVSTNYECDVAPSDRIEETSLISSSSGRIGVLVGLG